jgi:cell wall-associated NlpC family hydrolase
MPRPDFPPWVAAYVGLPYVPGGKSREGADCWGLVSLIHEAELQKPLPPYEGPLFTSGCDRASLGEAAHAYSKRFPEVQQGAETLGDVILLRSGRHAFHCGLILSPGWMLHSEEKANGACVETYEGLVWSKRIISIHRYDPCA